MDLILNYITWDVSPELFRLGPVTPRWYGLLFASGFLIGLFIVRRMFREENVPEEWLDKAFMYVVLGAVIGARLGHVFFYDWDYYSQNLTEIPMIWRGGLASHGGAIGIILSLWIFSRRVSKRSILWILDKVVVPTALAGCFIRMGNFMNSEIVGNPYDGPLAVLFVRAYPPLNEVPRHPVQLYEAASYLLIFVVMYFTYWRTKLREKPGFFFGLFLALVFGARFILEPFKHSQGGLEETINNSLSTGQLLSIPFVLIGLFYIFRPNPKKK
jgi:prolipoprotein diacylglyceryl transferase